MAAKNGCNGLEALQFSVEQGKISSLLKRKENYAVDFEAEPPPKKVISNIRIESMLPDEGERKPLHKKYTGNVYEPPLSKPLDERLQKDRRNMHKDVWDPHLVYSKEQDCVDNFASHTTHKGYTNSLYEAQPPKPFDERMQKDRRNMVNNVWVDPRLDFQVGCCMEEAHCEDQDDRGTDSYLKPNVTVQPTHLHNSFATGYIVPPLSCGNQLSSTNGHILRDSSLGIVDIHDPRFIEKKYLSRDFIPVYPAPHRALGLPHPASNDTAHSIQPQPAERNMHANEVNMKTISDIQNYPDPNSMKVIDNHLLQYDGEKYRKDSAGMPRSDLPQLGSAPSMWVGVQEMAGMGPPLGGFSFQRLINGDITGLEDELEEDSDGDHDEMDQNLAHVNEQVYIEDHDSDMYSTMYPLSSEPPIQDHDADFSDEREEHSDGDIDYNSGEVNEKDAQEEHESDMYSTVCTSPSRVEQNLDPQMITFVSESPESYDMYKGHKGISKCSTSEWMLHADIHMDGDLERSNGIPLYSNHEEFHGSPSLQWEGQCLQQTSSDSSRDLYSEGVDSSRKKEMDHGSPCLHPTTNSSCPASPDYITERCAYDDKQLMDNGSPCLHPVIESETPNPNEEETVVPITPNQNVAKAGTLTEVPSTAKALLLSGVLEGCQVSYKDKCGGVKLTGIVKNGGILCNCKCCKGESMVNVSLFERHAGSTARHPSDNIFIDNGMSLSDILRSGMKTEVKSSKKVSKVIDESARKNQSMSTGASKRRSDAHFSKVVQTSSPSQMGLDQMVISQGQSRRSLHLDETESARKNHSMSSATSKRRADVHLSKAVPTPPTSQTREMNLHKMLFLPGGLADGTEVAYYFKGQRILTGKKEGAGICCGCCNEVISCSLFEAHAGWGSRRNPYSSIYLSDGQSLHMFAQSLEAKIQEESSDKITRENDDDCAECGDGGDLVLCDACPRAYHTECAGLSSIPEGDWYCPSCEGKGEHPKRKSTRSSGHLFGASVNEKQSDRCQRIVKVSKNAIGGCVICKNGDFLKSGFGEKTVLLCDQCEREYHVGCMKEEGIADLKELPAGEWFCGLDCTRIHKTLQELVVNGPQPIHWSICDMLKKKRDQESSEESKFLDSEFSWQLLHGRRGDPENGRILSNAATILMESFDPIIDAASGRDLISLMVHSRSIRDQDFRGVYCAVLKWKEAVVSTAIIRIFGRHFAELPLVATNTANRGQGFFQVLMLNIERLLGILQVEHLLLPAAEEAESIWINKFGFSKINNDEQLQHFASQVQIMIFQGSSMLLKSIRPDYSS